jgi:hypothetical protein
MLAVMNTDKIVKLIKMLSSSNDGEVINAARAILRTLAQEGADIHELAARVENGNGELSEAEMQKIYNEAFHRGKDSAAANAGFHNVEPSTVYEMACDIKDRCFDRLEEREQGLVNTITRWYASKEPSEKQSKWLRDIYRRTRSWR